MKNNLWDIARKQRSGLIGTLILLSWLLLFSIRALTPLANVSVICLLVQIFVTDIINIILVNKIYKNSKRKNIVKWFTFSIYVFFIVDVLYFTVYSFPHQRQFDPLFNIMHCVYYFTTISFIVAMLKKSELKARQFLLTLLIILIISFSIFAVFSIDTQYIIGDFSLRIKIDILQSVVDLTLFSLAFLWLIYSKNIGTTFIASGYIVCTASEFMMTSCYMTGILYLLDWAQLTWSLGLLLIMIGMIIIIDKKDYSLEEWLVTTTTIKVRLIFSTFIVVVISLILLFMVIREFSVINDKFFIFSPTIIMDSTLIVALFSMIIGRMIDKPLLQIQNDIKSSLLSNKSNFMAGNLLLGDSPRYSEIQKIEIQIKSLISFVDKQSKDAAIGTIAKEVAHNIKSPLLVLSYCKNKLKTYTRIDESLIKDIEISINNIKYTLINLLNINTEHKFQTHEDSEHPRYILLKPLIDEIMNQKTIEWHNKCELLYVDNIADDNIWIFTFPINFINSISNLLNNSLESLRPNTQGLIEIKLYYANNAIILSIKDNGSGIEEKILDKVMYGYSTKDGGEGIGLSTARRYFTELGGKLDIPRTGGDGTTINITIPIIIQPDWLPTDITISEYVVVLDDSPSIHGYLQSVFSRIPDVKYYMKIDEFKQWANEHTEILHKVTYFIDNQLDDSLVQGIDLIESYKIMATAYLTTNEFGNQLIQGRATKHGIKIIPKPLIKSLLKVL